MVFIQEKPYIFFDFNVGDCLGLENCFRSCRAKTIPISKLYAMICGPIEDLLDLWSTSRLILRFGSIYFEEFYAINGN